MDAFTQNVGEWHDFYMMVGTAAATLIGLLFVGLTVNIETIRRVDSADLYTLAAETFNSFFYLLLFAMLFLIPAQTPLGLGIPLMLVGALGLGNVVVQLYRTRKRGDKLSLAERSTLPIVALTSVVIIALSVLAGQTVGFYLLVPVMLMFLASATRNAWDLLIGMRGANFGSTESKGGRS